MSDLNDTYNHERFIEQATVSLLEQARSEKRAVIRAVTQMDGSTRRQTVKKRIYPLYWRLIDELPVLLNTASHLQGEATVETPIDAHRTFFRSGMGALVLASFLVQK